MIFWACFAFLAFNFYGYIAVLFGLKVFLPLPFPGKRALADAELPELWVLVPCYNEAAFLRTKVENLLAQDYPAAKLTVVICDGGSTDGSRESLSGLDPARVRVIECRGRGKVAQLNEGIALVPEGALAAVSDADALLSERSALRRAAACLAEPGIGVVGAWGVPDPSRAPPLEQAFWDKQNRMRFLESQACTSSIVTAQLYVFARSLIPRFPDDCVADDVYAAFRAHGKSLRVIYSPEIEALELRQPGTIAELMRHKFRKAHAYTVELLRHLYLVPGMRKRTRFLFFFKLFQFFYLPWVMVVFLLSSAARAALGQWASLAFAFAFLFFGTLIASFLVSPPSGKSRGGLHPRSAVHTVVIFALVNLVLMANSLSFPFWSQSSRYPKVGSQ